MNKAAGRVRTLASVVVLLCLAASTLVALLFGVTYNWPDNLHTNYGFPWVWGTHLTDSFIGPVDKWTVSVDNLALDLVFWLGVLLVAFIVIRLKVK